MPDPVRPAPLLLTMGAALALLLCAPPATAQQPPDAEPPTFETSVVDTPRPGGEPRADRVPAAVQTATDRDLDRSGALDVSDFLNRRMSGVHINEVQNNPFQPDVNYRGYTASPLLGTPQGLAVYLDGVRLNQPFGEAVSWDLIPRLALASSTLMGGSNPVFGLNALGGSLALQTRSGLTHQGGTLQMTYGSNHRRSLEFGHGGRQESGWHWYGAGTVFGDDGWRVGSPTEVGQAFGKVGRETPAGAVAVTGIFANTSLTGNGLQVFRVLALDYTSSFTRPDTTDNTATLLNVTTRRAIGTSLSFQANAYYRHIATDTLNGDINEESLEGSVYQPGAAERAALAAAGYPDIPAAGLDATNTPFPFLRCLGNVLLQDEPAEACNGLLNRTASRQHVGGASGQVTHRSSVNGGENLLVAGAAFERSSVRFSQSSELGYLNPDRSVTGTGAFGDGVTGAFGDGVTGGEVDGEPFDVRVDLDGTVTTTSLFAVNTLPLGARAALTISGRYNRSVVDNRDGINPGGGPGSLDGRHVFQRLNPSVGVTADAGAGLRVYASYSEGSRAATSIELGCADPEHPCRLPNAMAGDPPLRQVVTGTLEGGVRGTHGRTSWNAGYFLATNRDDILFVLAEQTGFGYFRNFGRTRRQGLEAAVRVGLPRATIGVTYTFLDATFRSGETVNGESNSSNGEAAGGVPGVDGEIAIEPGHRIPLIPRHLFKAYAELRPAQRVDLDVNVVAAGAALARGNENGGHEPDGTYYLGSGSVGGYAVVNLSARYALTSRFALVAQVTNVFDRRYATAAQLGPAGFGTDGAFTARPFPAVDGEYPLRHTTFLAPGAPRRAWAGIRARF